MTCRSQLQERAEVNKAIQERYLDSLRKAKEAPNLKKSIELYRDTGVIAAGAITNKIEAARERLIKTKGKCNEALFFDFLIHIEKKTKLLETEEHTRYVLSLFDFCEHWIRPVTSWTPKTYNRDRQFSGLLRHLFSLYDMPAFLDNAWTKFPHRYGIGIQNLEKHWFVHIATGKNIRKAELLPFPLTKKMAHHFLEAPKYCSLYHALKWAQVKALGGDERLFRAIRETNLMGYDKENDFILSVLRFFVENPMLDMVQVGPIVDYIWNQKYHDRRRVNPEGVIEVEPPEQPNFSMHGRTADTLLAQVQRWHRQLGKENKGRVKHSWEHHPGIKDFKMLEGNASNKNQKIWTITQLLSSNELDSEGRAMRHCAASYGHSCARGAASIWSMCLEDKTGFSRCVTIEVRGKQICQVRGKNNRRAAQVEQKILGVWSNTERLTISSYFGW